MSEPTPSPAELQARWDKIRVANVYDTLDKMGYGNQCLDLSIRPLFPHYVVGGRGAQGAPHPQPLVPPDDVAVGDGDGAGAGA